MAVEGGTPYRQRLANRVSARKSAKRKRELAFSSPAPMEPPVKAEPSLFERLSFSPLFNTRLLGGMAEQRAQAKNRFNIIKQAAENPNLSRKERRDIQISAAMESPEVKGFIEEYGGSGVIGSISRRGAQRIPDSYREEVMDIAESIAKSAAQAAPYTVRQVESIVKRVGEGRLPVIPREAMEQIKGEDFRTGQYVVGEEEVQPVLDVLTGGAETLLGKIGQTIRQKDLPRGINIEDLVSAFSLGRDAPLQGVRTPGSSRVGEVQILGATPSSISAGGTSMFRVGAETGEELATIINPNFRGNFNPQGLTRGAAREQIELLQEVRGGIPVLRTGRVLDLSGEKIHYLSRRLYNAHDHAAAKAREASTQAIEQRLADALNIQLSDDFIRARQERLDFVNNPNENDVLIDFLANSGKGGVGLSKLPKYLQQRLDDPSISAHQRAAYRQMLGDVLGPRYKEIEKRYRAITNQVENPLKDVVSKDFLNEFGDAVDILRRRLREKENYTNEMFNADLARLSDAAEEVARQRGKVTWGAVRKASGIDFS